MMFSHASGGTPAISYLFIDGGSLHQTLKKLGDRYFGGTTPILDWGLVKGFHRKVFYYDAVPVQLDGEDDNSYSIRVGPKRAELNSIEHQVGFHVRSGDVRHRKRRGNEQKMVDVHLAVDALLMASRGLFSSLALITGDLDFRPLVSALVEMGIDVHLIFPPGETNEQLLAAADRADPMTVNMLSSWLTSGPNQENLLPIALYNFKSEEWPDDTLCEWDSGSHGRCCVVTQDGGTLLLLTNSSPANPDTHRLELKAHNAEVLRAYASDVFDLIVPEWS